MDVAGVSRVNAKRAAGLTEGPQRREERGCVRGAVAA